MIRESCRGGPLASSPVGIGVFTGAACLLDAWLLEAELAFTPGRFPDDRAEATKRQQSEAENERQSAERRPWNEI